MGKWSQKKRWLTILSILTGLMVALVAIALFAPGALWKWSATGEACIKCGTIRIHSERAVLGIVWARSTNFRSTEISQLREKYIGSCAHEWAFQFYNERTLGGGIFGDGFPEFKFPVIKSPRALAIGIEALPDSSSKVIALEAVGSSNLLSWIAAAELENLASIRLDSGNILSQANWWKDNSNFFVIVTNAAKAKTIAEQLADSADGNVRLAAERTLDHLEKAAR